MGLTPPKMVMSRRRSTRRLIHADVLFAQSLEFLKILHLMVGPADSLHDVRAEHTVALELRFSEKLVGSGFVRESPVSHCVVVNVARFLAIKGGLDVNQIAIRRGIVRAVIHAGV